MNGWLLQNQKDRDCKGRKKSQIDFDREICIQNEVKDPFPDFALYVFFTSFRMTGK